MLALLVIMGALFPLHHAAVDIGVVSEGVLTGKFPNGFLLHYPDCNTYANKDAQLLYMELTSTANVTKDFKVPACTDKGNLGYLLTDLKNGTTYSMWYKIAEEVSKNLTDTTANVTDFRQINDGLPARSGAMVVITVILVLAMAALLGGLIFLMFFTR